MEKLTYTKVGDYYIPDITLGDQPDKPIGKYGRMRQRYLKEHRPMLYGVMLLDGTLPFHLAEIDEAAEHRLDTLMPQLAKATGATEALKASDPMRWVGLINTCKAQAEDVIFAELIYQEAQNVDI